MFIMLKLLIIQNLSELDNVSGKMILIKIIHFCFTKQRKSNKMFANIFIIWY